MNRYFGLLAIAISAFSATSVAHAQIRPLNDPVEAHPDPESLFNSDDPPHHA